MNLKQIYDNLRKNSEMLGHNIDEGKLRQQAWVLRDKMLFEANFSNSSTSSAAGAGGGGRLRKNITTISDDSIIYYALTAGNFYYFIFNFKSKTLTDIKSIEGLDYDSYIDNVIPVNEGGYLVRIHDNTNNTDSLYFIGLNGNILWEKNTSNLLDSNSLNKYAIAIYEEDSKYNLVVFYQNGTFLSYKFDNYLQISGRSYEDYVSANGFVVREDISNISKYYFIKDGSTTASLLKEVDTQNNNVSIYQYGFSDKFLVATNEQLYEVYNSNLIKLSEINMNIFTNNWSRYDLSFLSDNGSIVFNGYDSDNSNHIIVFYSGISDSFSSKVINGSYNIEQDIYGQKEFSFPRNNNAEGCAVYMIYDSSNEISYNDILYRNDVKFLPIWSTDTQLRDYISFSFEKGFNTYIDDNNISLIRSSNYITILMDEYPNNNDATYSILVLNRTGVETSITQTNITKKFILNDDDLMQTKTLLKFQNNDQNTFYGFSDLSNLELRNYTSLRTAANNRLLNVVSESLELIMKDVVSNQYWAIQFTDWGQNNGGSFAYTRQLIENGQLVGVPVSFTHSAYGSEVDVIVPGVLELTRGLYEPIYNVAVESESNRYNPTGTLWNSIYFTEFKHVILNKEGQIIDSITTENYGNVYEGNTMVIQDNVYNKTYISNNTNNGQFTTFNKLYSGDTDTYNVLTENNIRLGNILIYNSNIHRIITPNSISQEFSVDVSGEFAKINDRYINENGVLIVVWYINGYKFYFYNLDGQLVDQRIILGSVNYSVVNYGYRLSVNYYDNNIENDTVKVIVFKGDSIQEINTNLAAVDFRSRVNDYYVWWD